VFPVSACCVFSLHGWLSIRERCQKGQGLQSAVDKIWDAYEAPHRRPSGRGWRRLRELGSKTVEVILQEKVFDVVEPKGRVRPCAYELRITGRATGWTGVMRTSERVLSGFSICTSIRRRRAHSGRGPCCTIRAWSPGTVETTDAGKSGRAAESVTLPLRTLHNLLGVRFHGRGYRRRHRPLPESVMIRIIPETRRPSRDPAREVRGTEHHTSSGRDRGRLPLSLAALSPRSFNVASPWGGGGVEWGGTPRLNRARNSLTGNGPMTSQSRSNPFLDQRSRRRRSFLQGGLPCAYASGPRGCDTTPGRFGIGPEPRAVTAPAGGRRVCPAEEQGIEAPALHLGKTPPAATGRDLDSGHGAGASLRGVLARRKLLGQGQALNR